MAYRHGQSAARAAFAGTSGPPQYRTTARSADSMSAGRVDPCRRGLCSAVQCLPRSAEVFDRPQRDWSRGRVFDRPLGKRRGLVQLWRRFAQVGPGRSERASGSDRRATASGGYSDRRPDQAFPQHVVHGSTVAEGELHDRAGIALVGKATWFHAKVAAASPRTPILFSVAPKMVQDAIDVRLARATPPDGDAAR